MGRKRKAHAAAVKAQVALAALKGDKTVNELAGQHAVHPTLIHAWKKQLLAGAEELFSNGSKAAAEDHEAASPGEGKVARAPAGAKRVGSGTGGMRQVEFQRDELPGS